ncbi:MAG: hypothetical protein NQU42_05600 [Methanothrix sp.]|uniref:hypothetical protein n=1 Tax=Methanothrix sp. TaxID=90426 RepID=UPI0025DDEA4E|nr:hypothetical protein [Methanothrix sp.]MCQ8903549.1 hypothetical protein [Methanothrix sp.]
MICILLAAHSLGMETTIVYSGSVVPLDQQAVDVNGIWSVSLNDTMITAAINQTGREITGSCRSDAWSGVISGMVSGDQMNMAVAALQGDFLISIYMSGKVAGEVVNGEFVRTDSSGISDSGSFIARRVSSDTSGYASSKRVVINRTEYRVSGPVSGILGMNQI